jgi:hypothetical protein
MSWVQVRKFVTGVEEILHEGGPPPADPVKRGWIAAVIANPCAGRYEPNLEPLMEDLKPLGIEMATRLLALLGGDAKKITGYGKGSIVGQGGELEHGALWHSPGGYSMRTILGEAKAIVPSTKKVGGPGTRLDVPVTHVNASYVRSHYDAVEVGVPDGPKANEMVVVLVMTIGGRVHARMGGLKASEIKGEDGLR